MLPISAIQSLHREEEELNRLRKRSNSAYPGQDYRRRNRAGNDKLEHLPPGTTYYNVVKAKRFGENNWGVYIGDTLYVAPVNVAQDLESGDHTTFIEGTTYRVTDTDYVVRVPFKTQQLEIGKYEITALISKVDVKYSSGGHSIQVVVEVENTTYVELRGGALKKAKEDEVDVTLYNLVIESITNKGSKFYVKNQLESKALGNIEF